MRVANKKCIRRLAFKNLQSAKLRNLITVIAVALTTVLFTTLFTIALSMVENFQQSNFRQVGTYAHGIFKELTKEQFDELKDDPLIKEWGLRRLAGLATDDVFNKSQVEVSYMDENCTKWSYAIPKEGRMPQKGMEVSMDTTALKELGAEPVLGEEITITYPIRNSNAVDGEEVCRTDTFTLVGFWEYDNVIPVHYINVSKEYMDMVEKDWRQA